MITFIKKLALILLSFSISVTSWKTCDQTFCGRVRRSPEGYPRYSLDIANMTIEENEVSGTLITDQPSKHLNFILSTYNAYVFYIQIKEISSPTRREKIPTLKPLKSFPMKVREKTPNTVTVEIEDIKAIIFGTPFKVEIYSQDKLISIINPQNRLVFELDGNNSAIAMDVSFVNAQRAYGLPLHAENLALQNTGPGGLDPYRLFNVNNEDYKIKSTEALHGAVPRLFGHGTKQSSAIQWENYGQTWVDITVAPNQVDAFFMSETTLDKSLTLMVLTGPTLAKTMRQLSASEVIDRIPQYFALGYHQSRQSYMTHSEVLAVVEEFNRNALPLDAVYLDIEYTENQKSFTWDPERFPNPVGLQKQLARSNKKLVVAIDPQFKIEKGYFVHDNFSAKGYYVRNLDGSAYIGLSRSGLSGYFDTMNENAVSYYMGLFLTETFKGENIYFWNNMNEPVVFENLEHENTLPGYLEHRVTPDLIWKHREIHNMYGSYHALSTDSAVSNRDNNRRSFVLTRSHSTLTNGMATWTGNNYASWENLEISFPMCLTEALVGNNLCGADVGGFYGIPDDELYQRWYQAAAWLPFYRGSSAKEVPRREPYLYSDGIKSRVRIALNQRYAHLPVWYTLFVENQITGDPVIRPITYHYPNEDDALSIDNEILIGANILAAPVLKKGASIVPIYLPGGGAEIWYNIDDNYKILTGTGYHLLEVNLNSVPVFYRGGSIIPRKDIPRQSTVETYTDPFTLYICLDKNNQAKGSLYVDDYESYNYQADQYLYLGFSFANNTLSSYKIHPYADYGGAAGIGEIIILSPAKNIVSANIIITNETNVNFKDVKLTYSEDRLILTINNILLSLQESFRIEFSVSDINN